MRVKTNKTDINIPSWLVIFIAIVADSMYVNHCKKSTVKKLLQQSSEE